ncbi:hypothetical protein PWG14_25275 [Chromobacterium amazonense]|uniref:hypothetical protein n=1 Tax=Chromobacterium amazonense TaxID=1382803 RepID=UPI00126A29AD|nr:hypothetical protein [Chromobacterium amazonense]MDE1715783.1 hypothetical protein [Chromobacterium amazonense]
MGILEAEVDLRRRGVPHEVSLNAARMIAKVFWLGLMASSVSLADGVEFGQGWRVEARAQQGRDHRYGYELRLRQEGNGRMVDVFRQNLGYGQFQSLMRLVLDGEPYLVAVSRSEQNGVCMVYGLRADVFVVEGEQLRLIRVLPELHIGPGHPLLQNPGSIHAEEEGAGCRESSASPEALLEALRYTWGRP